MWADVPVLLFLGLFHRGKAVAMGGDLEDRDAFEWVCSCLPGMLPNYLFYSRALFLEIIFSHTS